MYKKILLVVLGCMLISSVCLAETRVRCEIESDSAVSYYVDDTNSQWGSVFYKTFVKYVSANGDVNYWVRIGNRSSDRLMYYADLCVDDKSYRIDEIENVPHKYSQTGNAERKNEFEPFCRDYYSIPQEAMSSLLSSNNQCSIVVNKQKKQGIELKISKEALDGLKEMVGLTYVDKDKYWQPNLAK